MVLLLKKEYNIMKNFSRKQEISFSVSYTAASHGATCTPVQSRTHTFFLKLLVGMKVVNNIMVRKQESALITQICSNSVRLEEKECIH